MWDPYHVHTYDGYSYFLTIVDDFTRSTWTRLLKTKGNVFQVLKGFIFMVETRSKNTVKIIRSDNALELGSSKEVYLYLKNEGILHQTICIDTP